MKKKKMFWIRCSDGSRCFRFTLFRSRETAKARLAAAKKRALKSPCPKEFEGHRVVIAQ